MVDEVSGMPTAEWDAFFDDAGNLFEGYEATGDDAALVELMGAWERIEDAYAVSADSPGDGMAAQEEAADYLQHVVDMLRSVPVSKWKTGCYRSV